MKQAKKKTKAASEKAKSGRKQPSKRPKRGSAQTTDQGSGLSGGESPPTMRFSATIHAREQAQADPDWMEKLAVDRIPDVTGLIRALVTPDDCVRLVNQGYEVHLDHAYPVQPLDPALIEADYSFKSWLDERVQTIKGATTRKGSKHR